MLYAIIPLTLFGLGLLGGLGLDDQWTTEWAPAVQGSMSQPAFQIVDDTVRRVLGGEQQFWMLASAVLAIWKVSAGMRAITDVFDRIYESRRERSCASVVARARRRTSPLATIGPRPRPDPTRPTSVRAR